MKRTIIIACCLIAASATQTLGQVTDDFDRGFWVGPTLPVLEMTRGGNRYYLHRDHNRCTVALADAATGLLVEQVRYKDFGTPEVLDVLGEPIPPGQGTGNPYLFRRLRLDEENDFYWCGGSYYESSTGRFSSRGPNGAAAVPFRVYRGTVVGNPGTVNARASVNPWSAGGTVSVPSNLSIRDHSGTDLPLDLRSTGSTGSTSFTYGGTTGSTSFTYGGTTGSTSFTYGGTTGSTSFTYGGTTGS
ncbi:MAG: hypothetical protein ACYSVY_22080, partial [Planctomycetota bacterium]